MGSWYSSYIGLCTDFCVCGQRSHNCSVPCGGEPGGRGRGGRTLPRELSLDWNKIAFQSAFYIEEQGLFWSLFLGAPRMDFD